MMRRWIEGKKTRPIVRFATIFFLLSFFGHAVAQTLPPSVTALLEQLSEDPAAQEELAARYEALACRRPDLNTLSREELEETGLFSLFQIESLLDHISRYGAILSTAELSTVDGFTPEEAARCRPFFRFGSDHSPGAQENGERWRHSLLLRTKWRHGETAPSLTGKYTAASARLAFSLTADHDAGEPLARGFLPDFLSVSAVWKGERDAVVERLALGDFTARFGQGLILWKAFRAGALLGEPGAVLRNATAIRPYTSTDESNFFRGAALTLRAGAWHLTALASFNAVDARLSGGTAYTSIATDGLHRTAAERAKRHSMHETLFAASAQRAWSHLRIGLTATAYTYDKRNGRTATYYNAMRQYDGWWGNLGADLYWHSQHWRIFAEAALDAHPVPAFVAGALWSPVYALEASLLLRCYPPSYTATHAGAYSTLSECANQTGATLALRYTLSRTWRVLLHGEYTRYPGPRYGHPDPSDAWRARAELSGNFPDGSLLQFQLRGGTRFQMRAGGTLALGESVSAGARLQGGPGGWAGYLEGSWTAPRRKVSLHARVTAWSTEGWDDRIAFYEKSLPQSYGVRQFYGKGTGAYLLVKVAPVKRFEGWIRLSDDYFAFLIRSFIPG